MTIYAKNHCRTKPSIWAEKSGFFVLNFANHTQPNNLFNSLSNNQTQIMKQESFTFQCLFAITELKL